MLARPVTHLLSCSGGLRLVTDAAPRIAGPAAALRAFATEARRARLSAADAAAMVREEMS